MDVIFQIFQMSNLTLEKVQSATFEQLQEVSDVGVIVAKHLHAFFNEPQYHIS